MFGGDAMSQKVKLIKAGTDDLQTIWEMQVEAFAGLYKKYHDTETIPAKKERII